MKTMKLVPAKKVTVQAVGEFAYIDALRTVPSGSCFFELVPEPDNPYDPRAISVRYQDRVVAYISQAKTKNYWQTVCKVVVSGSIPIIEGEHQAVDSNGEEFHEIALRLLSGTASLPASLKSAKPVKQSDVPNAYGSIAKVGVSSGSSSTSRSKSNSNPAPPTIRPSNRQRPAPTKRSSSKSSNTSVLSAFFSGVKKGSKKRRKKKLW